MLGGLVVFFYFVVDVRVQLFVLDVVRLVVVRVHDELRQLHVQPENLLLYS